MALCDHYGFTVDEQGLRIRRQRLGGELVESIVDASGEVLAGPAVTRDIPPSDLLDMPVVVHRLPTLTVWEALATAVLRQVVQAPTARARYARLVDAASVDGSFPSPTSVLRCDEREMAALGLRFCWATLERLARWAVDHGADQLCAQDARRELLNLAGGLKGVGPWSLAIAAWDLSCDPLLYPHGDYVVQAGARALLPDVEWPRKPGHFALRWAEVCGDHLGDWTMLALLAADADGRRALRPSQAPAPHAASGGC